MAVHSGLLCFNSSHLHTQPQPHKSICLNIWSPAGETFGKLFNLWEVRRGWEGEIYCWGWGFERWDLALLPVLFPASFYFPTLLQCFRAICRVCPTMMAKISETMSQNKLFFPPLGHFVTAMRKASWYDRETITETSEAYVSQDKVEKD